MSIEELIVGDIIKLKGTNNYHKVLAFCNNRTISVAYYTHNNWKYDGNLTEHQLKAFYDKILNCPNYLKDNLI